VHHEQHQDRLGHLDEERRGRPHLRGDRVRRLGFAG
jgi:hypothetical protein